MCLLSYTGTHVSVILNGDPYVCYLTRGPMCLLSYTGTHVSVIAKNTGTHVSVILYGNPCICYLTRGAMCLLSLQTRGPMCLLSLKTRASMCLLSYTGTYVSVILHGYHVPVFTKNTVTHVLVILLCNGNSCIYINTYIMKKN